MPEGSVRVAERRTAARTLEQHAPADLVGDFLKAGRAGDVDLGQRIANDVQAHQQQAAGSEDGAEVLGVPVLLGCGLDHGRGRR